MKEKTTYIAIDGEEFENQEDCQRHQYSLIDWKLFNKYTDINRSAKWVDIDKYTYEVIHIKPIGVSAEIDYFFNMLFYNHNYLWIPDVVVLEYFQNTIPYLSAKDRNIMRNVKVGLNFIRYRTDDGDYDFDWEVINVQNEMQILQQDLAEVQGNLARYKTISDNFFDLKSLNDSLIGANKYGS